MLSGFFLVLQILILLEFVYIMNEWLLHRVDRAWARASLVVMSLACYIVTLGIIVVTYIFYAPAASCSLNIFFITWTLIMALILTALSVGTLVSPPAGSNLVLELLSFKFPIGNVPNLTRSAGRHHCDFCTWCSKEYRTAMPSSSFLYR